MFIHFTQFYVKLLVPWAQTSTSFGSPIKTAEYKSLWKKGICMTFNWVSFILMIHYNYTLIQNNNVIQVHICYYVHIIKFKKKHDIILLIKRLNLIMWLRNFLCESYEEGFCTKPTNLDLTWFTPCNNHNNHNHPHTNLAPPNTGEGPSCLLYWFLNFWKVFFFPSWICWQFLKD